MIAPSSGQAINGAIIVLVGGLAMADDPDIETEKGRAEILKDMDATLRRMLKTPPKPHKKMSYPRRAKPRRKPPPKTKG
jgi:hypothetical protein